MAKAIYLRVTWHSYRSSLHCCLAKVLKLDQTDGSIDSFKRLFAGHLCTTRVSMSAFIRFCRPVKDPTRNLLVRKVKAGMW